MAPEMTTLKGRPLDRPALESILKRRFFYAPTAEIYGQASRPSVCLG
jgi:glycyl-tRNA synthetase